MVNFTPEILDQIRSFNDIVEVVSGYLPLKKTGKNYRALCPFHTEKTPSFTVSPEKQIFHCFGCGVGGDVISFIMLKENMTFPEAVRYLGRRANLDLPSFDSAAASRKETLRKLHDLAAGFYHWGLTASDQGASAREYLEERGIKSDTVKTFRLGYALPSWDSFLRHARRKGFQPEDLLTAGLILKKKSGGGYYDRFRNRLIIPVRDVRGRTIAFGGRVLDDSKPKYINSPDTPLFRKGNMLFGLDLARDFIQEKGEAIVGEGYFDVIRSYQENIRNMVSSQGTAFTPVQAQILKRYTDKILVAFDADEAGKEAALRGLTIFLEKEFEVRIAMLPPGSDPDSFISEKGAKAFRDLLGDSIPLLDFKLADLCRKYDIKTDQGKIAVSNNMIETISRIESAIIKESYVRKLASRLGVSPEAVWNEYGRKVSPAPAPSPSPARSDQSIDKYEIRLLKIILEDDNLISLVADELDPEAFSPSLQAIVAKMLQLHREGRSSLSRELTTALSEAEDRALVTRWLMEPLASRPHPPEIVDLLVSIKKKSNRRRISSLKEEIARPGLSEKDISDLQMEALKLKKETEGLQKKIRNKFGT